LTTETTNKKAALLMLAVVILAIGAWEIYLRSQNLEPSYDDNDALWANQRARVYEPADETVVFIGSSRIKYDLDIPTWEKLTGKKAVMLAMTGSNPRPVLANLANDEKFKGHLVIDVTEILFLSNAPFYSEKPNTNLAYYKDRTPAQLASFQLNHFLESQLVFLDEDYLTINAKLKDLQIPNRPGVFVMPPFPIGFERTQFSEQALMSNEFVSVKSQQQQMIDIWHMLMSGPKPPPMPEEALMAIIQSVKSDVEKIQARGGDVIFVRTPSTGMMGKGEKMAFAKDKFWDKLLKETRCKGFHYADSRVMSQLVCIEESHLKPTDAVIFTTALVKMLQTENNSLIAKTN
jgi:hypothetical protein